MNPFDRDMRRRIRSDKSLSELQDQFKHSKSNSYDQIIEAQIEMIRRTSIGRRGLSPEEMYIFGKFLKPTENLNPWGHTFNDDNTEITGSRAKYVTGLDKNFLFNNPQDPLKALQGIKEPVKRFREPFNVGDALLYLTSHEPRIGKGSEIADDLLTRQIKNRSVLLNHWAQEFLGDCLEEGRTIL